SRDLHEAEPRRGPPAPPNRPHPLPRPPAATLSHARGRATPTPSRRAEPVSPRRRLLPRALSRRRSANPRALSHRHRHASLPELPPRLERRHPLLLEPRRPLERLAPLPPDERVRLQHLGRLLEPGGGPRRLRPRLCLLLLLRHRLPDAP